MRRNTEQKLMFGRSTFGDAVTTQGAPMVTTSMAVKKIAIAPQLFTGQWVADCAKIRSKLLEEVAKDTGGSCAYHLTDAVTMDYQRQCAAIQTQNAPWLTVVLEAFVDAYNRGGQAEVVKLWGCALQMLLQQTSLSETQAKLTLAPLINQANEMTKATQPATAIDRQPQRVTSPAATTKDTSLIPQQHEVPSTTTTKMVPETQKYEVPLEPTEKVVTMPSSETAPIPPVTEPGMAPVPPWTNGADWSVVQAAQCIAQGGTWTGTECMMPKPTPVTVTMAKEEPNYLLYGAIGIGVLGLGVGIYALTRG